MNQINKKITGFNVKQQDDQSQTVILEKLHEGIKRPEILNGSTVKIKSPASEHAIYVTINFYVLNAGTEYEEKVPYELFINSKNMEHFQWVLALTRTISAAWRKGGESQFLIDEMKTVFDPKGGYFKPGGKWMNSLVAEIGQAIEQIVSPKQPIEVPEKVKEAVKNGVKMQLCPSCNDNSAILMDGCLTCTSCGFSRCG